MRRLFFALAVLLPAAATAAPPAGTDPTGATAQWFQGLTVPDNPITQQDGSANGGCCSLADCRPVEYRQDEQGYAILIGKQFPNVEEPFWARVPPEVILQRKENPIGQPVACYYAHKIRCFVRPWET